MLEKEIKQAIVDAVKEEQQPSELADKIIAWMENLVDGNEDIVSPNSYTRRCDICFEAIFLKDETEE